MLPSELSGRPWQGFEPPAVVKAPKGMVSVAERACYYWLGRHWLSGKGCIVDAGAFLGASTLSFAAGAADGGHPSFRGRPIVQAYDYFKVVDPYVGEAISRDFRPIGAGDSYLDIFHAQTAACSEQIEAHPGDFMDQRWHGDPIEILFIDIAKTAALNSHAIGQFFPKLIPGQSVLVHQDYFHCWHPYIHIGMEFFADEFEMVDEFVPHQSRVWRLTKPLPAAKIARMAAYDLTREERLALLERLIARSSAISRPMLEVVRLWQHCLDRDFVTARATAERIASQYDAARSTDLWARQLQQVAATMTYQAPARAGG